MSADENRNENVDEELKAEERAGEPVSEQQEGETPDPENDVDSMEARMQELQDQMLRTQAEMQNVRRRAEIDVEKAHKFALEKFVKELLPVADSLEKAVESTENQQSTDELVVSIREGVEMTLDLFMKSLGKFNVKQLNPVGEPFDPQVHGAGAGCRAQLGSGSGAEGLHPE